MLESLGSIILSLCLQSFTYTFLRWQKCCDCLRQGIKQFLGPLIWELAVLVVTSANSKSSVSKLQVLKHLQTE